MGQWLSERLGQPFVIDNRHPCHVSVQKDSGLAQGSGSWFAVAARPSEFDRDILPLDIADFVRTSAKCCHRAREHIPLPIFLANCYRGAAGREP
jgi:hypothetical protein